MGDNSKKIVGFKRFSDIKESKVDKKSKIEEIDLGILPKTDSDIPMNPNLPEDSKKIEKTKSVKNIQPFDKDINLPTGEDNEFLEDDEKKESVETFGKLAKFPKNIKASKAYNFLENVKISKKSIWYIMVEKDENQLQVLKYNYKEGVDLNKFVNELKEYYFNKYKGNKSVCESISNILVDGNDKYSMVRNVPSIEVDGKKLITKITEDLIRLLSK
jgi:hypothetical protein